MLVLIYEGTVTQVFDYDYAPQALCVNGKRINVNISQEGRDDIDDLRESKMVDALKLTSENYQSSIAVRITQRGIDFLSGIWTSSRAESSRTSCSHRQERTLQNCCRCAGRQKTSSSLCSATRGTSGRLP